MLNEGRNKALIRSRVLHHLTTLTRARVPTLPAHQDHLALLQATLPLADHHPLVEDDNSAYCLSHTCIETVTLQKVTKQN